MVVHGYHTPQSWFTCAYPRTVTVPVAVGFCLSPAGIQAAPGSNLTGRFLLPTPSPLEVATSEFMQVYAYVTPINLPLFARMKVTLSVALTVLER
jgi:hypothetical protein